MTIGDVTVSIAIVDDEELQKRKDLEFLVTALLEIKFQLVKRRNFMSSETEKLNCN